MVILYKKYTLGPPGAKVMWLFLFWANTLRECIFTLTTLELATLTLVTTTLKVNTGGHHQTFLEFYNEYRHYWVKFRIKYSAFRGSYPRITDKQRISYHIGHHIPTKKGLPVTSRVDFLVLTTGFHLSTRKISGDMSQHYSMMIHTKKLMYHS